MAPSINSQPSLSPTTSADERPRKRVRKACDRCRTRKLKCDGCTPCWRCTNMDTICSFSARKCPLKPHATGYVEMLEREHSRLVAALRKSYKLLRQTGSGPNIWIPEAESGYPLTQDILKWLDLVDGEEEERGKEEVSLNRSDGNTEASVAQNAESYDTPTSSKDPKQFPEPSDTWSLSDLPSSGVVDFQWMIPPMPCSWSPSSLPDGMELPHPQLFFTGLDGTNL